MRWASEKARSPAHEATTDLSLGSRRSREVFDMSRLIEGLARRLVEREAVPRRDLLTGRRAAATAGIVVPLVGAAGAGGGRGPPAEAAARPSKPPPLPARSDLRAIHIAVM